MESLRDSLEIGSKTEDYSPHIREEGPTINSKTIRHYFATRIPTLLDLPGNFEDIAPVKAIRSMSRRDWNYFLMGYMGWTIDSMDFFCVSASTSAIAETLNVSVTDITWGITLVLMLRSVGAIFFGFLGDHYGRKWPLIACYVLFIALELGTGFVQTYSQFLAVRALFGIVMGGCYGLCVATFEDAPVAARGFLSGLYLPGYNLGYIFAVIFFRAFEYTPHSWRALFWFSSGPPVLLIIWRVFYPDTNYFLELKEARRLHNQKIDDAIARGEDLGLKKHNPFNGIVEALRVHWLTFIYLVLLLAGCNFNSHGSQDLFPTMLKKQVGLSADAITVTMVVLNLGAMIGGAIIGQLTELTGRRLGFIFCCILGGAFIYPVFFIHEQKYIIGCGFFLQAGVMGIWSIIPSHQYELLANTEYRALLAGLSYQLGNLASSASSTIESQIGSRFPLPEKGVDFYDYGKVMAIFMGCVFGYIIIVSVLGPENFHAVYKTRVMVEQEEEQLVENELASINSKPTTQLAERV
ncbi:unnamed protein product [[Candida] boidinii]|uniref:Unnamed protein product n=1 Tax=Candida boidinii TaxID=5477 RepID=A0A9W6SYW4_CANBO|nr:hypothetical protein BVG19_g4540 [[Candida] boidinii]OWB53180.1 hypothetical protein B5S27_g4772 [[Candida] boidinii]OWB66703.1 hypothetical protein B5S30_g2047 [[Candida] boidinii]OWB85767.1 hypothetical protein B5S33_g4438 [[Candida] boidinii]GME70678.1 unnamed protein product [[Candida] boidinii]